MEKPVLVIMAAGMGSRYGGLKQIDPVDSRGHMIIDYSVFDAKQAGFDEVIFVIKKENETEMREAVGNRMSQDISVKYAFQDLDDLPGGYVVPEGRIKPWGTAHAVYAARHFVHGPFAVINADDYYGRQAFELVFSGLSSRKTAEKNGRISRYVMVGYELKNTVTDHGSVSRGVCKLSEDNGLLSVTEIVKIEKRNGGIAFTEDGSSWQPLDGNSIVSMNMWGFTEDFLKEIEKGLSAFLDLGLADNPLRCEYYLPFAVSSALERGRARVDVLKSTEKWYGITYREDKQTIVEAVEEMVRNGKYPQQMWKGEQ